MSIEGGPMEVPFAASRLGTLGVEWEIALVDRDGRDLASASDVVLALLDERAPGHRVHRELLKNTVELVTDVARSVDEAMADLAESLDHVLAATDELGLDVFSAGMHPFAAWEAQEVTSAARYDTLIDRTQYWGRQMLIYGVHVHVGLPERDRVLPVLSSLLRYFPHLQALSASSPYYLGTDTGYASTRALLFQQLPTAGLPFQFQRWDEYEAYAGDLMETGVIDTLNEIRWDVRPSPALGTLEVRVCDAVTSFDRLAALVALVQCLVVDLDRRAADGEELPVLPPWHVQENKWRSARYGTDAIVVVGPGNREVLVTEHLAGEVARLQPLARELGCEAELLSAVELASGETEYARQRRIVAEAGGDLAAVVVDSAQRLRAGASAHR
jgi:carboxylate-amine ligase